MAKDEKDLEGDDDAPKTGGKKKLIILLGAVVLLLLIGVGAALFLMGGDEAAEGEGDSETAEAEPVVLPDPLYYQFNPPFVVNLPPGGQARMLQLNMQVMTRDQAVVDYLTRNAPMVRHHLFNLFSTQDAKALYGREGRESLAKAIEEKLESIMKEKEAEGDIEAVYFTELVLQ